MTQLTCLSGQPGQPAVLDASDLHTVNLLTLQRSCAACVLPDLLPHVVQFCRLNQPPESFLDTMRPVWLISPSYYHYKGCTCMGNHKPSYITK